MSRILGVDPGLEGAVAVVEEGILLDAWDLPHVDGTLDAGALHAAISALELDPVFDIVVVERVSAFPGNGSMGNFKLGFSAGTIAGVVGSLGLPLDRTSPSNWKRRMSLTGKTKDAARLLVRDLYPTMTHLFELKKDVGRADATLIALDYYRQNRAG